MSKQKLIEAMHASNGCQVKSCTEWLSAAQTFDDLGKAFRKVYGKKLPSVQKLGRDLTAWAGKAYGDLRLISIYNTDVKAARYCVETQAESAARESKQHVKEIREETITEEKYSRAFRREMKAIEEAEAKRREEAELAQVGTLTIEVVHPAHVAPPVKPAPPLPPPSKPPPSSMLAGCKLIRTKHGAEGTIEEWQKPDGSIVENWITAPSQSPGWQPAGIKGQPSVADLKARHHQYSEAANVPRPSGVGLPMPGVSAAHGIRHDTSGAESWMNRLHLKDF